MEAAIEVSRTQLACIALEAYLYGLYCVLAALAVWLLFTRRARNTTTIMLIIHTFVMFGVSTGHVGVILEYIIDIFLYHDAVGGGDEIPSNGGSFTAFIILLLLNCIIGDLVVIWRVWVIWGYCKKAAACPALSWAATIVVFIGSCSMLARPQGLGLENGLVVSPWVAVFMGLTLVTNFTAVGAVAYRYWRYRKEVGEVLGPKHKDCHISTVLILMIESGFLYCVSWTVVFAAYLAVCRVLDIVLLSCVAQMTAMYPTLIVVLVCLRTTERENWHSLSLSLTRIVSTKHTLSSDGHSLPVFSVHQNKSPEHSSDVNPSLHDVQHMNVTC